MTTGIITLWILYEYCNILTEKSVRKFVSAFFMRQRQLIKNKGKMIKTIKQNSMISAVQGTGDYKIVSLLNVSVEKKKRNFCRESEPNRLNRIEIRTTHNCFYFFYDFIHLINWINRNCVDEMREKQYYSNVNFENRLTASSDHSFLRLLLSIHLDSFKTNKNPNTNYIISRDA